MLDKDSKQTIVKDYQKKETDSGSTEIQVALITERIKQLTGHLAAHRSDYSAQRSLLKLVGHRRKLLGYLSREDVSRYNTLIGKLGLRK